MSNIYFADKGHTRRHRCPNMWPVKDKHFYITPKSFMETPGLKVYINPKLMNHERFDAEILVIDPRAVEYVPNWDGSRDILRGGVIVNGTYVRGELYIRSRIEALQLIRDDGDHIWKAREESVELIRQALTLHKTYFPEGY